MKHILLRAAVSFQLYDLLVLDRLRLSLRTLIEHLFHLLLQIPDEARITLARNHRQHINVVHRIPEPNSKRKSRIFATIALRKSFSL